MQTKYKLAIFDFDGTLADSFPFFMRVFNQIAEQHGFKTIDPDSASNFRHYTAKQLMKEVGLPTWKLPFVAKNFISLMQQNQSSISLFGHVDEMLLHLSNAGVMLAIVSSNSYDNISQVLGPTNTNLMREFECGMSIFGKASRIKKVLKKTGIAPHEAIYIGDQVMDLEAARKENVAFGAVAWGYGAIESLRAHTPEHEFHHVLEIQKIV